MYLPAVVLSALLAAPAPADSARPAARVVAPRAEAPAWTTLLAFDEVRVEVDAAHLGGAGAVGAWLRWTFAERAASPAAWDAGVRSSLDAVEVDCAGGASRTLASSAFDGAGGPVAAASYAEPEAAWRRHAAGGMGARVVAALCRLAGR